MSISIRRAEPGDYEAMQRIFSGAMVVWGTLQLPFPSLETWRKRLELELFVDNEPAVRLYQKFGFVIEGTLSHYAFRDGRYVDVYAMARLKMHDGA